MTEDLASECSVVHFATNIGSDIGLDLSEFNESQSWDSSWSYRERGALSPGRDRGPELSVVIFVNTPGEPI